MGAFDSRFPSLDGWVTETTDPALAARVAAEVGALAAMGLDDLRSLWRRLTRSRAPEHLRPWLLRKILAYRIKARAFGDLDAVALKVLAEALRAGREVKRRGREPGDHYPPQRLRGHRPGTIFLREHDGEMHRVIQRADGFEYRGEIYASLSRIAKVITGTSWNGPRFFGLREGRTDSGSPRPEVTRPLATAKKRAGKRRADPQ